ncbi:MAG: hypothetical protein J5819_03275 [Eubacterium sp.]|nr:hypothetical protein [Eubacterium sp.]
MRRVVTNDLGETIVTIDAADRGPLSEEELEMISRMDDIEDEYDEDCPPIPEAMICQMRNDIEKKRHSRRPNNSHSVTIPNEARA